LENTDGRSGVSVDSVVTLGDVVDRTALPTCIVLFERMVDGANAPRAMPYWFHGGSSLREVCRSDRP
jgi:hypothetical protein